MHVISNLYDGGAEGALYNLCLYTSGFKLVVVCMMDKGKYGPMLEPLGVSLYYLHMPQGKPTFKGVIQFWRLLRSVRPDIVQTWMYHADLMGGVMARMCGVRKVFWGIRHGNLTPGTVKDSTIRVAKVCAWLSSFVPTHIVSCSQQAIVAHTAIGYDRKRMLVIPNGYELSRYVPDKGARARLRQEWGFSEDSFLFGMVARFDAHKDHGNLLGSLQLLKHRGKEFHCFLVGTGMEAANPELQQLLNKHGVAHMVSLLGRRNDVPAVMNALDLHVLSSLGEAFPNVLAEAMACGTPCVTTDVGDAAFIVGDTGWVVPPKDSLALADGVQQAMETFAGSHCLWQLRQSLARARIANFFSIEQMSSAFSNAWNG